ncbi:MAG: heavy-metal-associated domain-containing protein, partial [Acidimicrobiales bacterium]|nr:heavy-metal-associated domain-containing protein [Acidimicrobiales bacterium]
FQFTIVDASGTAVTDVALEHEKRLHLVIASRDLTSFEHLHPTMDDAGTWTVDLPELEPGAYRAFADFRPTGGEALTLGVDLSVPGPTQSPEPLLVSTTDSVDGYDVTIEGDLSADGETEVVVDVRRDGRAVVPDPYLGAPGHLVALRYGDLAYLHVHPVEHDGPGARFAIEVPSPGTYALFFDFAHDGAVHTARFVLDAGPSDTDNPSTPTLDSPDHGDAHD